MPMPPSSREAALEARRRDGAARPAGPFRHAWPSRRAAPTARSTADRNPLAADGFRGQGRSCWPRSTPMPAAVDPRVRRCRPRSPASGRRCRSCAPTAPACADVRPLVRLNVSVVVEATATGGERRPRRRRPRSATSDFIERGPLAGGGATRRCARRWSTSTVDAGAGRRDDGGARDRAGPASCCTRRSATGSRATSTARRPRPSPACSASASPRPGVTVVDDGTIPDRRGSLTVDDEGTPSQPHRADRGRHPGRLHAGPHERPADGRGSRPATAGARAIAHTPMPRMTNTVHAGRRAGRRRRSCAR